jgi:uncharacterized membrane protein YfcA
MDWLYTCSGFFVGMLVGATGVGGGSLMTPILVLLFGVPATTAVGTDLLFASITKGVGTALHGFNRSISWRIVGALCVGSLPASAGMLWLLHGVLDREAVAPVIKHALGIALVITSCALLVQAFRQKPAASTGEAPSANPPAVEEPVFTPRLMAGTIATGGALGALVTLTSVGAGALGVMVLMALFPRVRSVRIVGTDIAHAVPLTLLAGLGHAGIGGVDFKMLGWLLLGSIPGIAVGAQASFRLPERAMKQLLAAILMVVGSKLVF